MLVAAVVGGAVAVVRVPAAVLRLAGQMRVPLLVLLVLVRLPVRATRSTSTTAAASAAAAAAVVVRVGVGRFAESPRLVVDAAAYANGDEAITRIIGQRSLYCVTVIGLAD